MKKTLCILLITALIAACTACHRVTKPTPAEETHLSVDTTHAGQIHPVIQTLFYNLPLDKSRLALREIIANDKRFTSTYSTFNNYKPLSFFKGIARDNGLIQSKPDSVQVMLVYGNAALTTEKGGQPDTTKHPMILNCQYFFSNKESAELEYGRILTIVHPIYTDTSTIQDDTWETDYSIGEEKGTQKCVGKIFDSFEPYYRVAISTISYTPSDGSQPVYVLELGFSKEDK